KLTVTGTMLGTPGYISPEQVYNVPNLDGRSDLFSLGCVLYRCLSGRAPFRGPDALRILLNGTSEQLPRLRELRPSIPRPLDELVARLLARQPDDRPRARRQRAARPRGGAARRHRPGDDPDRRADLRAAQEPVRHRRGPAARRATRRRPYAPVVPRAGGVHRARPRARAAREDLR